MKRRESHGSRRASEIKSAATGTATPTPRRKRAAPPRIVSDRLTLEDLESQIREVAEATAVATTHLDVKRGELKLKALRAMIELIDRLAQRTEVRELQAKLDELERHFAGRRGNSMRLHDGAVVPRMKVREGDVATRAGGAVVPRLRRPPGKEN